jgi:hypothetical protein
VLNEEPFATALDELTKIKDYHVVRTLNWYRGHARVPMILFRTTGVLLIVLSVSVPLLAVLEGIWQEAVLPVVALVIAGLTGLNSFFQWHTSWQGYRQTQYALEHLIAQWELKITEAKHHPNRDQRLEMVIQATDKLLRDTGQITATETGSYFERVRVPDTGQTR